MAIRIPTTDQSKIFLGSQQIGAVYVGANKVWPDAPAVDPNACIIEIYASGSISIPFYNTTGYNGTIDWGDGTTTIVTAYNDSGTSHYYASPGTYTVTLRGIFKGFYYYNKNSVTIQSIRKIIQWGNVGMSSTDMAFYGCLITNVGGASNVTPTSFGVACFYCCTALTNITIPSSVSYIGNNCFYGCTALTNITIPSSVTTLWNGCFQASGLTNITIPSTVTTIGTQCVAVCNSLTSLVINCANTGTYTAVNCKQLTSVTIGINVRTIGAQCFYGCSGLTSITIPSSVTTMETQCFAGCANMITYIINATTPPALASGALVGATDWKIYVPSASVTAYKATAGWSSYASRIVAQ